MAAGLKLYAAVMKTRTKAFRVVCVSSNQNSFGLTGMIIVARDGTAYQVGANQLNVRGKGTVISVPVQEKRLTFGGLGFEIPQQLPRAPRKVVAEIWS